MESERTWKANLVFVVKMTMISKESKELSSEKYYILIYDTYLNKETIYSSSKKNLENY